MWYTVADARKPPTPFQYNRGAFMHTLICQSCNTPFPAKRRDAITCSKRCRQRRLRGFTVIQAAPYKLTPVLQATPDTSAPPPKEIIRFDDPRFTRPSRPLTSDDRDEINYSLQDAGEWFTNFGTEPTSAFMLTGDMAEDPMSQEMVDLLIEKLQRRDDLAYLGGPDHQFVYNKAT